MYPHLAEHFADCLPPTMGARGAVPPALGAMNPYGGEGPNRSSTDSNREPTAGEQAAAGMSLKAGGGHNAGSGNGCFPLEFDVLGWCFENCSEDAVHEGETFLSSGLSEILSERSAALLCACA